MTILQFAMCFCLFSGYIYMCACGYLCVCVNMRAATPTIQTTTSQGYNLGISSRILETKQILSKTNKRIQKNTGNVIMKYQESWR